MQFSTISNLNILFHLCFKGEDTSIDSVKGSVSKVSFFSLISSSEVRPLEAPALQFLSMFVLENLPLWPLGLYPDKYI